MKTPLYPSPLSTMMGLTIATIAITGTPMRLPEYLKPFLPLEPLEAPAAWAMPVHMAQAIAIAQPQIYLLRVGDGDLALEADPLPLPAQMSSDATLKTAIEQLLSRSGGADSDLVTMIPEGTRLLDLRVTADSVYVNLSREFTAGGGSDSMLYRVGQVVFTATSLNPQAQVVLAVEGEPLDESHPLGGEGLVLPQMLTRQVFVEHVVGEWQ
jgi:Sporulation and spore germination